MDQGQLERIRETDCIVLLGGKCDAEGQPVEDAWLRCKAELRLRKQLTLPLTIVSGGPGRGVEEYIRRQREREPEFSTTEARQMIGWAVKQAEDPKTYLEEPFALDTLGNLVFSTKLLLLHDMRRPVFLSQVHHLYQLQIAAEHWFAKGDIKPIFSYIEDTDEQENIQRAIRGMRRSLGDSREGYGFPRAFARETLPLPSANWELPETKWAFEVAIRWLFRFSREEGQLRYPQYYNEDQLLDDFGARSQNEKAFQRGMPMI